MKFIKDGSTDIVADSLLSTSLLVIKHNKEARIKVTEQIYKYSPQSFIAEVGGVVGIFLGLSFWSIYSGISFPLQRKLIQIMERHGSSTTSSKVQALN